MDALTAKQLILSNPEVRKEYEKPDIAFDIAKTIIKARAVFGINQKKLAELVGTKQPSIARLESGNTLPSLSFLSKVAEAFGTRLHVEFEMFKEKPQVVPTSITYQIVIGANLNNSHYHSLSPLVSNHAQSFSHDYALTPTNA